MNWKKGLTIGILAITAISLVGCAVFLNKYKQYKPKTQQVNADYGDEYTEINNNSLTYNTDIQFNYNLTYQNVLKNSETNTKNSFTFNITPTTIYKPSYNTSFTPQASTYTIENINISAKPNSVTIQFISFEITNFVAVTQQGTYNYSYRLIIKNYNIELYRTSIQIGKIENFTINTNAYQVYNSEEEITKNHGLTNTFTPEEVDLFTQGNSQGYSNGNTEGYNDGYTDGNQYGYQTGYTAGYQAKGDLADGNFLDVRNMMLSVLTMPFTFINQAFNVTLWEGTAYAFNIGNFIKGLIAIASILFIIKLFTSGFAILGNYTGNHINNRLDRQQKRANINKTKAETRRTEKLAEKGK